ncbi:hypothetical protein GGI05_002970, partial [Coemansia sp. RSA 2603]
PRGWDESGGESDDHLHTPGALHLAGPDGLRVRRAYRSQALTPQNGPVDAYAMRRDVPTCPSGCGCNCLYESRQLII